MNPPEFWQRDTAVLGRLLAPLGWIYAQATAWRLDHADPWRSPIPVICIGNLTAGGSGKTPVVRDLALRLARSGRRPAVLSRGYGGRLRGPLAVDPTLHTAAEVGDEPLLLSRETPCWIAGNRALGAKAAIAQGADVIVMDDGFQNPSIAQKLKLVVVDGATGFGNGRTIPAGPLRERIASGIGRADALILIGEDLRHIGRRFDQDLPVLRASLRLRDAPWLAGRHVIGFAGIGRPGKFRASLVAAGAEITAFQPFADHHRFTDGELRALAIRAERQGATLVTTEKDWVRLGPGWRERIRSLPVDLIWRREDDIERLLERTAAHD